MLFSCRTSIKDFKVCSFLLIQSWHDRSSKILHLVKVLFALTSTRIGISSLPLALFIYIIVPMSRESSSAHENTTGFSRFQLNGRVLIFWYQRAQNLTCLFRVGQSNWTLRIISKDLEIRFPHVTLSQNFRTAFTHSLVVSSVNTQNSLVVNFGAHCTVRT